MPVTIRSERFRRAVVDSGRTALSQVECCTEATRIVELEDLPAGAVAVLLLLVAVLLILST